MPSRGFILFSPGRGGGGARKRAGKGKCRVALRKPAPSSALRAGEEAELSRHHAGLAALDRKRLQRRNIGLGIVRIRDHPHLPLHMRALEIDTDITAPPTLEEMDMGIIGQRLRDE